jgi:hypothetical protein
MSTPPPPATQKEEVAVTTTGWLSGFGILALIPVFILFTFHLGAGYLSYQKFGSIGWAILDFLFAYFYYPYYAFFLASAPAEPSYPMMGGMMKGLSRMLAGKRK